MAKPNIQALISRGVSEIIVQKDLEKLLLCGKKLRIKHGVDPTKPDLHLGHAVIYRKLRQFQDLGHTIIFLVGDFTARFGDPTDKIKSRSLHSKEEVEKSALTYLEQVGKILDKKKLEIRRNSEWYEKMRAEELLKLMSHFTVARMLERDMFTKRLKGGEEIGLHEPVYPVLQAYDSVMLKSDLTVIGNDQLFNELQARPLQEFFGQKPQQVLAMKLLVGLDGRQKMSKSLGNYIAVKDSAKEIFGKVMSLPDCAMATYAELLTDLDEQEFIDPLENPKNLKIKLAKAIVTEFHSMSEAEKVAEEFNKVHKQKAIPEDIPEIKISTKTNQSVAKVLAEAFGQSVSAIRRDIEQGGVSYEGKVIKDPNERAKLGLYKKGKRHFVKLKKKD
ncbi:MAG: tyrosine--tRNA ligase [Patescibacteria group bacterium]|jgi:tyrosyl-tRNA synthetase